MVIVSHDVEAFRLPSKVNCPILILRFDEAWSTVYKYSEQEGSGQSKGCRLTGKPTRLGWPDGSPVFSCSVRDQTREVQEFLYRELLHRTRVVCSVGLLEDYFLAFVAGFEEQGFNCYYPLGDGRERIQTVIVSLRGR